MYDYKKIGAQRRNEIHLNERARNPTWVLRLLMSVLPSAMHSRLLETLLPVASETLQAPPSVSTSLLPLFLSNAVLKLSLFLSFYVFSLLQRKYVSYLLWLFHFF